MALGAHLDSWDLGTGTTDNGTGAMVVLRSGACVAETWIAAQADDPVLRYFPVKNKWFERLARLRADAHRNELPKISSGADSRHGHGIA